MGPGKGGLGVACQRGLERKRRQRTVSQSPTAKWGMGSGELVPRAPPPSTGRFCFPFQLGPPASRTPSTQDPPHPGPPSSRTPRPVGSRVSSAAAWRAGPGDNARPRVPVGATAALGPKRGREKRVSLPHCHSLVSGSGQAGKKHEVLVAQSRPTLCDPMDCGRPGSSVHGILQARILEWVACPPPGDLPTPGTEPGSPVLQADSLGTPPPREGSFPNSVTM